MFIFLFQFLDYYFRFFFGLARSELFLFLYLYTCFGESFFYINIYLLFKIHLKSSSFPVALLTDIHSLDCNKFKNVVGTAFTEQSFLGYLFLPSPELSNIVSTSIKSLFLSVILPLFCNQITKYFLTVERVISFLIIKLHEQTFILNSCFTKYFIYRQSIGIIFEKLTNHLMTLEDTLVRSTVITEQY